MIVEGWGNYSSLLEISFAINISANLAPHWWNRYKKKTEKIQEALIRDLEYIKYIATSLLAYGSKIETGKVKKDEATGLRDEAIKLTGRYDQILNDLEKISSRSEYILGLVEGWLRNRICPFLAFISISFLILGSGSWSLKYFPSSPIWQIIIILALISPNFIISFIQHKRHKTANSKC